MSINRDTPAVVSAGSNAGISGQAKVVDQQGFSH